MLRLFWRVLTGDRGRPGRCPHVHKLTNLSGVTICDDCGKVSP